MRKGIGIDMERYIFNEKGNLTERLNKLRPDYDLSWWLDAEGDIDDFVFYNQDDKSVSER